MIEQEGNAVEFQHETHTGSMKRNSEVWAEQGSQCRIVVAYEVVDTSYALLKTPPDDEKKNFLFRENHSSTGTIFITIFFEKL
jgi:hypothetical protein